MMFCLYGRLLVSNTSVNILDRRSPLYLLIIYLKDPNGTGGGSKTV